MGWVNFMPNLRSDHSPYHRQQCFRRMLHHDAVKAPLLQKVYSVSSLDIQATPASDSPRDIEIADFVKYQFTDAIEGEFPQVAESILLPALLTKNSVCEKVWRADTWPRGRFRGKRFYRTLKSKENAALKWDKFRNLTGVEGTGDDGKQRTWDPKDFVIFRNLPLFEDDGTADLEAVYDLVYRLDTIEQVHLIHLDKFTSPATVATYEDGMKVKDADGNETPIEDALQSPLQAFKSRNWIIVPKGVQLEALQLAQRGEAEFAAKCDELRQRIALALSGAYLQLMAQQGTDIRGDASGAKNSSELLVWALAAKLASTLNTQATPQLVDMNYLAADYPKLSLGGVNYAELLNAIKIEETSQRMGFPLSLRAHGRKYSLQTAATPADTMHAALTAPLGFPGASAASAVTSAPAAAAAAIDGQVATSQEDAATTGDVQGAALNGAQISSLVEICGKVATGELTATAAAAIMVVSFPLMDPASIEKIVRNIKPQPPPPPTATMSGGSAFFQQRPR
jgi:hypothetical protein